MDLLSLKRDSAAVSKGVWVDGIKKMGNLRLKVRGFSSPEVMECRTTKERAVPQSDRDEDGFIKLEVGMQITREVLAESVLLDWENLELGGKGIPYSIEKASEYLLNLDFTPFADVVANASSDVDDRRGDAVKAVAKNSGKSSSGK